MANMNHTPTPYRQGTGNPLRHSIRIINARGMLVAEARSAIETYEMTAANAAFIVRACNAHYDLVEALEMLLQDCKEKGRSASYRQAESALKLARGE